MFQPTDSVCNAMENKTALISTFKSCLNILRDNEGLTGEKALRTLSYLLILKLIEPRLGNEIDIDTFPYDYNYIRTYLENNNITTDTEKNIQYKRLLSFVRFSTLANEPEDNIPRIMKYLWDDILSVHPTTNKIFLANKEFDIKHQTTYKKLIDKLQSIDISGTDYDVLGNAYEEVIQNIMTGKVLGQFFTPPKIKHIMVNLINPQIHPDGTIETCCDPTMGTGGFLITCLHHIMKQATAKNINPNWEFIKTNGLYGKEIEPDTYQLAVSNMLISSGHMFNNLDNGDSIRVPITRKFDNIIANPPFGIKGLRYDDFDSPLKSEYVPIKTDNAVSLFIQAIIYMLNIGGKCAVVLPDGQDLFSKTNKTLVTIREYLMKTCELQEIIYLPSGMFAYTPIKTCIFYFVKRVEGNTVLETTLKISKTQKVTGRTYKFAPTHQTPAVKFYAYNADTETKTILVEVPMDVIAANSYSLNYAEYVKVEKPLCDTTITMKTIGELCNFLPKSKRNAKYGTETGSFPFFKSSNTVNTYVDEADYNIPSVIIGDGGEANVNYGTSFSTSDHCYILQTKNAEILNIKFLYYYLYHNLNMMNELYTGVAIKNISKASIESIEIPVPCIERQTEIVEYLDFVYETSIKTSIDKIAELKISNVLYINNQSAFGKNNIKPIGECCDFKNGKGLKRDTFIDGEYPVIGGGQSPMGVHNEYNTDENTILCSSSGSAGFISKYTTKVWASDCFSILPKPESIDNTYLYYLLKTLQPDIYKLQTGTAQPHVYSKDLQTIEIPVPSLDRQREIVAYCEFNDSLIAQLEREIENNKSCANQFMTSVLTPHTQPDIADETPAAPSAILSLPTDPPAAAAAARKVVVKRKKPVAV